MRVRLPYGKEKKVAVDIPDRNVHFIVDRAKTSAAKNPQVEIRRALSDPINARPLSEMVSCKDEVLVLGDDLTRPTPQDLILPVLLDELNAAGVPDKNIEVLIALGTHRPMTEKEIMERFGPDVLERVPVVNHDFKDANVMVDMGKTKSGISVSVNRKALDADFVIGVGNVVPHVYGWGGGGKIIQPGVCGEETTGMTHVIAGKIRPLVPKLAGKFDNPVMKEVRAVAMKAGLNFIVNTVLNHEDKIAQVMAGDPVEAHRKGVKFAEELYCPKVRGYADIVVVSTYPADIDYWQALKPLGFGTTAVKQDGTIVFITPCPERISPTHPTMGERAMLGFDENLRAVENNEIEDLVAGATLLDHAQVLERAEVICYSKGLTKEDKEALGFREASTVEEAMEMAFESQGKDAKVGVLKCGEILPVIR